MSKYGREPQATMRDLVVAFRKREEIGMRPIEYVAYRNGQESPLEGGSA